MYMYVYICVCEWPWIHIHIFMITISGAVLFLHNLCKSCITQLIDGGLLIVREEKENWMLVNGDENYVKKLYEWIILP